MTDRQGSENITFYEAVIDAIKEDIKKTHVCLPARIESYDETSQSAKVLLMINEIDPNSEDQDSPEEFLLDGVPVKFYASRRDCFVSLPLSKSTFGCVVFSDKSLDDYLQSDGLQPVNENLDPRMHDLSDAVFYPGMRPYSEYIQGYSSDNMVLKNSNMTITLDPNGKISITGGSEEMLTVIEGFMNEALSQLTILVNDLHGGVAGHNLASTWATPLTGGEALIQAWIDKLTGLKI